MISVEDFIANRVEAANISCKSIVVTVFGDIVSQHGDWIWLGSLIDSLGLFGYSERLVRTSVYRLVKDNWLQVKKIGRKSYYAFTEFANKHYIKAAKRIYSVGRSHTDERWLVVIPSFVPDDKLADFKRQLKWLGFSTISSGVYAHPFYERSSLEDTIKELGLIDSVIVFCSETIDQNSSRVLKKLVYEKWNLQSLQAQYNVFNKNYRPLVNGIKNSDHDCNGIKINQQQSFLLRILLIHEFRRILLKDHELTQNMLPGDWKGHEAGQIVRVLYAMLGKKSCDHIVSSLLGMNGYLPKVSSEFKHRFNG